MPWERNSEARTVAATTTTWKAAALYALQNSDAFLTTREVTLATIRMAPSLAARRRANSALDLGTDEKLARSVEKRLFEHLAALSKEFPGQAVRRIDGREGARVRWLWAWRDSGSEEPCVLSDPGARLQHDADHEVRVRRSAAWLEGEGFETVSVPRLGQTENIPSPDIIAWRWIPITKNHAVNQLACAAGERHLDLASAQVFDALNRHNMPQAYAHTLRGCGWASQVYLIGQLINSGARETLELLNDGEEHCVNLVRVHGDHPGIIAAGRRRAIDWGLLSHLTERSAAVAQLMDQVVGRIRQDSSYTRTTRCCSG